MNIVAIALIYAHVMLIPILAQVPGFLLVFNVYTVLLLAIYAYEKLVASADEKGRLRWSPTLPWPITCVS